ncbi:hypothetical protein SASC598O02_009240 [Snodgrassella alvi SCGC AB-598-O02]|nr:hypothetical protein SASC598O02_009240 [Snodgrassella alvi SCGC AB-598-O02]
MKKWTITHELDLTNSQILLLAHLRRIIVLIILAGD